MATVNYNYKVDWKEYEKFITSFETYVKNICTDINNITNTVKGTVMVKGVWYDANAANFAKWWNTNQNNEKQSAGFGAAYSDVKTAFSELCHQPCVNLRKSQATTIDGLAIPKIKLYSKSADMYAGGIPKSVTPYTFTSTQVKDGEVTAVDKAKINAMIQTLSKNLKSLDTHCTELANKILRLATHLEGGIYIDGVGDSAMARTVLRAGSIFGTELQKQINASCTGTNAISSVISGYKTIEKI